MAATETAEPLSPEQALRLSEFARACKAATRVVRLYPATHPAIQASLARVADAGQRLRAGHVATLTVLPNAILLEGRTTPKPDTTLTDLATLLHGHLIGELRLTGDLTPAAWHSFLSLLARTPEDLRAQGGIGRTWAAGGGSAIELRQIDYAEVLRERTGDVETGWKRIVTNYLEGDLTDLDDETLSALFAVAADPEGFKQFTEQLVAKASEGNIRGQKDAVLRVLQLLADFAARSHPDELDQILDRIASVVPQLTPDMVVTLITTGVPRTGEGPESGIDLPAEVRERLTDETVAEFVAQSVSRDRGATSRLAQAFQTLIPDADRRASLLEAAEREAANLPIGSEPDFPDLWKSAASLLTTYSDSEYVSDEYERELSNARAHALDVDRISDDPPDRVGAWLSTVSDEELRRAESQVLVDLLAIETRADAWRTVLDSALELIDSLMVAGHIELAQQSLDAVIAAGQNGAPFRDSVREGLDRLRSTVMPHVVTLIRRASEPDMKDLSAFCRALGPSVIGPLADALAVERGSAVKRLREIVLSFGAGGRAYATGLRTSANPAVRRTAIEVLRTFGGADALPDLAALLDDTEPGVHREALRAIVQIGTNEAYATLGQALQSRTAQRRDAMMQVLCASKDERAAPLFVYILDHTDHRNNLESVYLPAIEALGRIGGDSHSVAALEKVLYRREWWAPRRTARLRVAAAMALRACGSAAADKALNDAVSNGPRGVRHAARAALATPPVRMPAGRAN